MGPRCDWVCLSKKCQQDGAATVYEDLPIGTTACPVCRSKRIQRLYNTAPGMIRSGGRHLQHVIDGAGADAQLVKADKTDARLAAQKRQAPMLAVPMKQLGSTLAAFGMQASFAQGGSRPTGAPTHPALSMIRNRPPRPGAGSRRDTQHSIPR